MEITRVCFVCCWQMGRGRTTTGTVIACLVKLRCDHGRPLRMQVLSGETVDRDSGSSSGEEGNNETPDMDAISPREDVRLERSRSLASFVMDDIPIVRKITRLLENGVESREALDAVIDRCAAMQNLRKAVLHYRKSFNQQNLEHHTRRAALSRGVEYLERYFMLIALASYLGGEAFDGYCQPGLSGTTFKAWIRQRPEVRQMKWSMRLRPARVFTIPVRVLAVTSSVLYVVARLGVLNYLDVFRRK